QRSDILATGKEPTWGVERGIRSPERAGSSRIMDGLAGQERPGLCSAPRFFGGCGLMRVLITGGAGFIGSHLADAYLERGDEVFVLDDLSTGSIDNIRHMRGQVRFHYTIESVHHA